MGETCICVGVRHVPIFESKHPRFDVAEIHRSYDRPVVAFRVDLDQVDVREASNAKRAFNRMTWHRWDDNVLVKNAVLAKMVPVKRGGHRSVAPMAIEIASAFTLSDRRL